MIASNHMLAGAAIAVAVKQPWLVLPMAFASHFLLDSVPHFGVHGDEPLKRNKHYLFKIVLAVDVLLAIALCVMLPLLLGGVVPLWVLMAGMLLAWLPDSLFVLSFFYEVRHGRVLPRSDRLTQFHVRIQKESVGGLRTEVFALLGLIVLIGALV